MQRICTLGWPLLVALIAGSGVNVAAAFAAEHGDEQTAAAGHTATGGGVAAGQDPGGQGGGDEHAEGRMNPLVVDPDLAIWTAVVFGCLVFLLGKFAWPTISAALLERERRIETNIADAEAMHLESKQMLAQHEAKLATAAEQVRELLDEARRDAEHTKTQIIAEAKQLAGQERERAVRDVQRATDHALQALAESSANLAVELAGKVVRQNITPDQQAALVREALGKLASSSPSEN